MEFCYASVSAVAGAAQRPVIVTGHSLGAARACLYAGLACVAGNAPAALVLFGSPKPGFQRLAGILSPVPVRSYRNGDGFRHDLVTDLPFRIAVESYCHVSPMTPVRADPPPDDPWGPFAWHHMALYVSAASFLPRVPAIG